MMPDSLMAFDDDGCECFIVWSSIHGFVGRANKLIDRIILWRIIWHTHLSTRGETMKLARGIAALLLLCALSACEYEAPVDTTTTPSPPRDPVAVGSIGYDEHLCERIYAGRSIWNYYTIDGFTYCYKQVGANVYDAYYWVDLMRNNWNSMVLRPVFQRDFSAGQGVLQLMFYSDKLWRRVQVASGAVEVLYNGRWTVYADYVADEKMRLANESAARQQAAAADRSRSEAELYRLQDRIVNMGKIWTAPACSASYNGCR